MSWTARRILKDLADSDMRRRVLTAFWKYADQQSRALATLQLAKALHFRDETIRKLPPEKKAELLASRIGSPELEQTLEIALMQYHTHEANTMMAAFLDQWHVPHGSIEADDYTPPTADQVRDAVRELEGKYEKRDVTLSLASAGLLMGGAWEEGTWVVVGEMV
ncbi:MAG: hypothetical protein ACRD2A_04665 [Vicinamibacterales bacterium]